MSFDAEAELAELKIEKAIFKAAMRLLDSIPGARSPHDAARILGCELADLLAEDTGLDRDVIERYWGGQAHT